MTSSDDTPRTLGRGTFLRAVAAAGLAVGLPGEPRAAETPAAETPADDAPVADAPVADAPVVAPPARHGATFRVIPEHLAALPSRRLSAVQQEAVDDAVSDIAGALQAFSARLSDSQRRDMLFPLDAPQRTAGRDRSQTPAFCAVLAWCVPGWGLSLGTLDFEQRVAFETFLRAALGPAGYETVSAVRNRQQIIGALEAEAVTQPIAAAVKLDPKPPFTDLVGLLSGLPAGSVNPPPDANTPIAVGGLDPGSRNWEWTPAGMAARWRQFADYSLAIFGAAGDGTWALRLEGHHLSVNLTFIRDGGHWHVHGTPLFIGAFPIVVPPPANGSSLSDPLRWQQGQSLGLGLTLSCKAFWSALPKHQRDGAWRPTDSLPQRPPLVNQTPGASELASLDIAPTVDRIEQGPHLRAEIQRLPPPARRQLDALFAELLVVLHPAVAPAYRERLDAAFRNDAILATWAGGDLADRGAQHFSSIALGPFLVELVQTPQYSVSTARMPWSNHLHVMLRDLESPVWGDPLGAHMRHDHHHF